MTIHTRANDLKILPQKGLQALFSALLLVLLLCSCGKQDTSQKTLYQHGMDLVGLLAQMAVSEDYGTLIGSDNFSFENLQQKMAAGDYTAPSAVYEITLPSIEEFLNAIDEEDSLSELSDSLKEVLNARSTSVLINQLNSQAGVNALAMSSLYMTEKTFVCHTLQEDTIYLYLFKSGYPITVSFHGGEDDTVKATGMFLLNEEINNVSLKQLKGILELFGLDCSITLLEE